MSDLFDDLAEALAQDIITEVKVVFKAKWDTLSNDERSSITKASRRYATLILLEKAGQDVAEKLLVLEATMANWKSAGQIELYDAFQESVTKIVSLVGVFAGKAARSFIGI